MNRRQKLVQQQFLDNEEEVIRRLESCYKKALKDINSKVELLMARQDADMQHVIYQVEYQKAMRKQIEGVLDLMQAEEFATVSEYIAKCYEDGFIGTMFDLQGQGIPLCFPMDQEAITRAVQLDSKISKGLYSHIGEDVVNLKKNIAAEVSRGIANGSSYAEVARQIRGHMIGTYTSKTGGAMYRASLIARTEGHRVQVQGSMDACYKAAERGADVVKQWDSTLDARTRPSHQRVDGEIRELDESFSNGLDFPGDPAGGAAEVCNCRCALLQRARWALDADELETLKQRAKYYGLDKSQSFAEYKAKYLRASADDTLLTRDEINQRVKNNKTRITDIHSDIRRLDSDIERHNITDYADLEGLKKSDISGKIKAIEEREAEIDPIVSRLYNRPERGTPEYDEWREWKRGIDRNAILEEQMELASEKANLQSQLRRWDEYAEWTQWKIDHPLSVLQQQRATLTGELVRIEKEIEDYKEQLAKMAIPKDWTQIVGDHDSAFDIKASNPLFSQGKEYKVNCQRCVPTYEMRRRGYDVVAKPNHDWGNNDYLSYHSHEVFEKADVHWGLAGTGKRDIERLLKEWGDGARAEVGVSWKGANSGHVFVAENVGGKIVYIDPQSGEMDVAYYFANVRSNRTRVWRIDNLRPTDYIKDCCEKRE